MANLASIKNALQIFKTTNATKWAPKTITKSNVIFEKTFSKSLVDGKEYWDGFKKVVTREDGQVLTGFFDTNGVLKRCVQKSGGGTISTSFDLFNHRNKNVSITTDKNLTIFRQYIDNQPYYSRLTGPTGITHEGDLIKNNHFEDWFDYACNWVRECHNKNLNRLANTTIQ